MPIQVDVKGRLCLVVGGGSVGLRKVKRLVEAGAVVRVVSRELLPELREMVHVGQADWIGKEYKEEQLDGVWLVFATTDDSELNARISRDAENRRIWINAADQPPYCSFIVPASVERGDLVVSVSTSGKSPAMAARIRAGLENQFGPEYDDFLRLMGLVRAKVLAEGTASALNKGVFYRLVDSDILSSLKAGALDQVDAGLLDILGPGFSLAELGFQPGREASA